MIRFEDELEKFKPILEIDEIEEQAVTEDISDLMDILKEKIEAKRGKDIDKREFIKEIRDGI